MSLLATLFDIPTADGAIPPAVLEHLQREGHLTETGLTRRARPRTCVRCQAWTVAGLDADILALEARCDPTPLSALGEVLALVDGRRTVDLIRTRGRLELEQRWGEHIDTFPAGGGHGDVLASHVCGQPIPATWSATSVHAPPRSRTTTPTRPPF